MLTRLHIENFKAWKDTGPLRLAPLTVYFGANSSGKSSLNQFLLLLKQTVESADRKSVFYTGDASTPVDLGAYRDLMFQHETALTLDFSLRWSLPSAMRIRDPKSGDAFSGTHIGFQASVSETGTSRAARLEVLRMAYALGQNGKVAMRVGMESEPTTRARRFQLTSDQYRLVRTMGRKWDLPPPQRFYGFPDEAVVYYQNSAFTSDLTLSLEQMLRGISYLGPLRELPRRIYTWPGDTPEHVGWRGERSIDAILAARDRRITPGYRRPSKSFEESVARWLRTLGLIDSFSIRQISEHSQVNEVVVRTVGQKEEVLLTDVGFGVSQVLPVVVQCFYAAPGTTIILEQPEIHLHPAVQSRLADLFIETIQAREDGSDRGIQLIVESHSEHFLRRLMRRVAEQVIDPDDVALYFCEPHPDGSRIYELDVDLFGNIRNWPVDFFGDPMEDIASQSEAALKRQIADS